MGTIREDFLGFDRWICGRFADQWICSGIIWVSIVICSLVEEEGEQNCRESRGGEDEGWQFVVEVYWWRWATVEVGGVRVW